MAIKLTNKRELDLEFERFEARYNEKAVEMLCWLGEKMVRYAREDRSNANHYKDQTGNLRNSIGYIVVFNGRVVQQAFNGNTPSRTKPGDPARAHREGQNYAQSIVSSLEKDKTYLVLTAGMDYAIAVEAKGYDVITGTGNWVESEAIANMEKFKRFLLSKK